MDSVQQIYATNQTPLSQTFRASQEWNNHLSKMSKDRLPNILADNIPVGEDLQETQETKKARILMA